MCKITKSQQMAAKLEKHECLPMAPGLRNMLERDVLMLVFLFSFRLNGSYVVPGVTADRLETFEFPFWLLTPFKDSLVVLLRKLIKWNSRSTRNERAMSTISSDSSSHSSASICCFRIFSTWNSKMKFLFNKK